MKRALFQLFNILMACVVLLSSTGFGLVEHSCQMRGTKKSMVVAFSDVKPQLDCSANGRPMPPKRTVVTKTECCQDRSSYENVDSQSSLSQLVAKFVKTVTETVLAGVVAIIVYIVDWTFDRKSTSVSVFESLPSPSGRDILTFVHRLLL